MEGKSITHEKLAIEGGPPLRTNPLPPWPVFGADEIEAVAAVLRSGKVNYWSGRQGELFEKEFAETIGCRHAVAVANGTVALELALRALEISLNDEVIVASRSFIASASCCAICGAWPVFADVDPVSQNITGETIRPLLTPRTKAIIAVHLAGWPCEMDPIMELAEQQGVKVIEDCAQALGAEYRGREVGSLGHAAAFSFCQDKILSTGGEGGMLTTNDPLVWQKAWSFKDHGKHWERGREHHDSGVFRWLHDSKGTNWRMTEMQAAIGRVQLRQLPGWIATRCKHAEMLNERLARLPALRVVVPPPEIKHAYYKYYTFLRPERLRSGWTRDRIVRALRAEGIPCGSGCCPEIYREKAFSYLRLHPTRQLPTAKQLGETSLMLPVHPTLWVRDVLDTCGALEKVLRVATVAAPGITRRAA